MNIAISGLILSLTALVLAVLLYYVAYQRRINRALNRDESMAHRPMPSPGSAAGTASTAATIVLLVLCFFRLLDLTGTVTGLRNQVYKLHDDIYALQNQISRLEKQEQGLYYKAELRAGKVDPNALTVELTFSVSPSKLAENARLTVSCAGREIPLTEATAGVWEGTAAFPLTEDISGAAVLLTVQDADSLRSCEVEELNPGWLTEAVLHNAWGSFAHTDSRTGLTGITTVSLKDGFYYGADTSKLGTGDVTAMKLVFQKNSETPEAIDLECAYPQDGADDLGFLDLPDRKFKLGKNDTLLIGLVSRDEMGFTAVNVLEYYTGEDTAHPVGGMNFYFAPSGQQLVGGYLDGFDPASWLGLL